jgi:hypothetical protein
MQNKQKSLRLQEQQKKNVQDQRSVMVQQNVQNERINLITRALYLPTCSVHIELLMMDAFNIRNM